MSYTITATVVVPDVDVTSAQAKTAKEAIEKARDFKSNGFKAIEIRDAQGRVFREEDFDQLGVKEQRFTAPTLEEANRKAENWLKQNQNKVRLIGKSERTGAAWGSPPDVKEYAVIVYYEQLDDSKE